MLKIEEQRRHVLRWLHSHVVISENELFRFYKQISASRQSTTSFAEWIEELRMPLKGLSSKITKRVFDQDGKAYFILIRDEANDLTAKLTAFSQNQIKYMQNIFLLIYLANGAGAYSTDVIQAASESSLPKIEAQSFINELIFKRWLYQSPNGRVTFGIRSLAELNDFFLDGFEVNQSTIRLFQCALCKELITKQSGCFVCPNEGCDCKMHASCIGEYRILPANMGRLVCCPLCSREL